MNKTRQTIIYLVADILSASIAWSGFHAIRKLVIEPSKFGHDVPFYFDQKFFVSLIAVVLFWLLIYFLTGTYFSV